jgi:hypothetical protein
MYAPINPYPMFLRTLLGKGDGPVDQKWLTKVEPNQAQAWRDDSQYRPFESSQGGREQRVSANVGH